MEVAVNEEVPTPPSELESLRVEMRAGFAEMRTEFANVRSEMRTEFGNVRSEFVSVRAEMRTGFADVGAEMSTGLADVRRYMDVIAEALRRDMKVVIEKVVATDKKVDRLITSNAVEHAAFIESIADHEVRLRILEQIRKGSSAP